MLNKGVIKCVLIVKYPRYCLLFYYFYSYFFPRYNTLLRHNPVNSNGYTWDRLI